jgi:outer membrane lipoprotein-sorting protein
MSLRSLNKKQLFAIAILLIFFGSTIAAAFIQALSQGGQNTNVATKLPERFKNSQYTPAEESAIISQGKTLMLYSFPQDCNCEDKQNTLRNFMQFNEDVFLSFEQSTTEVLSIKSALNSVLLSKQNVTEEKVQTAYCQVTTQKSDVCIIHQI